MRSFPNLLIILVVLSVVIVSCGDDDPVGPGIPTQPEPLSFFNFHEASAVVGQVGMTSLDPNASDVLGPQGFDDPQSAGAGTGPFYVPDFENNRVLGFAGIPTSNGATATFVLGQPDFTSNGFGTTSGTLRRPFDCTINDGQLFLADFDNNRVLIWNTLPTGTAPANIVVGQPDFTTSLEELTRDGLTSPRQVMAARGKLFVVDGRSRIMIWNSIPTSNGEPADVVVGQSDFTSSTPGLSQTLLFGPRALWTDGFRLVVADGENARVMIWNSIPTENGEPADVVVGAPDFTTGATNVASSTTLRGVGGVASDGTSLFVSDSGANRILIFTPFPTTNGAAAVGVIGQDSFTADAANDQNQDGITDTGPTERTLSSPVGIRVQGNRLLVADSANNRVLIYTSN
jgi:hypothetical protein